MFEAAIRKEGVLVFDVGECEARTVDLGGPVIAYDETPELAVDRLKKVWEWRLSFAQGLVKEAEAELALVAAYFDSKKEEK